MIYKKKREKLATLTPSEYDGSIAGIIKMFQDIQEKYEKEGYEDIFIETETEYGYYDDKWTNIVIYGYKEIAKKK